MAVDATEIYCRHPEDHDMDMRTLTSPAACPLWSARVQPTHSAEESKKINDVTGPVIIISASGMATGGRVLHHLKNRLPDPKTTVLLAGFQAPGTRGRTLQDGASHVRIFGELVEVRAKVETMSGLSAHGDRDELLRWASGIQRAPKDVYLVHGEPKSADALAVAIGEKLGWRARPAKDGETVEVG
jgi:metallo-beta-lactamase family protein